ncbi:MAG: hypothetical protein AB1Z98_36245 [Nannocystaceae bacterium]
MRHAMLGISPTLPMLAAMVATMSGACAVASETKPEQPALAPAAREAAPDEALAREVSDDTDSADANPTAAAVPIAANPAPERPPYDERFVDPLREVIGVYSRWGKVDDEARWAPGLCRAPRRPSARISDSDDAVTHGRKLYTVYALDPAAYGAPASDYGDTVARVAGLRQVVVKEAFTPLGLDEARDMKAPPYDHGLLPAVRDGKRYVPGERQGLFVMMKTAGDPAGTDAGWIYATVEPDMMTVSAIGVIASCAGCHERAGDGRLFGLPGLAAGPPEPHAGSNPAPL